MGTAPSQPMMPGEGRAKRPVAEAFDEALAAERKPRGAGPTGASGLTASVQ